MIRRIIPVVAAVCLLFVFGSIAAATEDEQTIYGWQLMTEQERNEFRTKMGAMQTEEERQALRYEHHERMKVRAREMGVDLSDEPGEYRKGMKKGPKQGYGRGPKDGPGAGPKDGYGRGSRDGSGKGPGTGRVP